ALAAAPERLLHDWRRAHQRCALYLSHLGVDEKTSREIAQASISRAVERESWEPGGDAYSEALRAMREIVVEHFALTEAVAKQAGCAGLDPFTAWRVVRAAGRTSASDPSAAPIASMPPILRGSMPRAKLERRFFRPQVAKARAHDEAVPEDVAAEAAAAENPGGSAKGQRRWLPWTRRAARRRRILSSLVLVPSILASWLMMSVLPEKGGNTMEMLIVVFFGLLFAWISIGFWTALYGFYTLLRREE